MEMAPWEVTLTALLSAGSAVWIVDVLRRLAAAGGGSAPGYGVPRTAAQAYRAFQRLFSARERAFLDEHATIAKQLRRKFERNRRGVFLLCLEQLKGEQSIASRELRELAVELDRPDLAREAIRRDVGFTACYWMFRLQVATGLPVTPQSLGWMGAHPAKPAPVVEVSPAYAEMERTAVR